MTTTRKEINSTAREWVIVCPACQVDVPGYTNPAEAGYLAGVHNDLHHGSRPDAYTAPVYEPVRALGGAA